VISNGKQSPGGDAVRRSSDIYNRRRTKPIIT